jgi:hypothetical protein
MQIDVARIVAARPSKVFATISDVAGWPEMVRSISAVEALTSGPIRAGARLRLTRIMFGHETVEELEIEELENPHRLRLTGETRGIRYDRDHIIDALHTGSRFTMAFRTRPATTTGRALQDFISPYMQIILRDELERDLADLAAASKALVHSHQ